MNAAKPSNVFFKFPSNFFINHDTITIRFIRLIKYCRHILVILLIFLLRDRLRISVRLLHFQIWARYNLCCEHDSLVSNGLCPVPEEYEKLRRANELIFFAAQIIGFFSVFLFVFFYQNIRQSISLGETRICKGM